MNTITRLIAVIADFSIVPAESIGAVDSLGDLGLDSLDLLQLRIQIEEEFEIELPERFILRRETALTTLHDTIRFSQP